MWWHFGENDSKQADKKCTEINVQTNCVHRNSYKKLSSDNIVDVAEVNLDYLKFIEVPTQYSIEDKDAEPWVALKVYSFGTSGQ